MPLTKEWQKQNFQPNPSLQPYFLGYRMMIGRGYSNKVLPFTIFPDGKVHILFHLLVKNNQQQGKFSSRLALVGPRSIFKEINRQNRLLTLIFSFRPGGAFPFFAFPLKEITDMAVDLEEVWGKGVIACRERMIEKVLEGELDTAVQILESLLLSKISDCTKLRLLHPVVKTSIGRLEQDPAIGVASLAASHGVSTRYLHQLFTSQVGIGVKRFCRIQRAMATLAQARIGWQFGWADLALTQGYYDQSHMIDEFQSLLGGSPEQMIAKR